MAKKKNTYRKTTKERSLAVRILAAIAVIIIIIALVFTMLPAYLFAAEGVVLEDGELNPDGTLPLVVDRADILTAEEEVELTEGLEKFRRDEAFDIVVVTVASLGGMDVVEYADRFYDENGYGGENRDGALIIVSTEYREWTMITSGYGNIAITDYGLDVLDEEVLAFLKNNQYSDAFKTFGDGCAYYVTEARKGNIIDYQEEDADNAQGHTGGGSSQGNEKGDYPIATNLGIAGVIGVVFSWITNGRKKAALKTVRYKNQAKDYVRRDSLGLTDSRERFLYRNTTVMALSNHNANDDNHHHSGGFGNMGGTTLHHSPSGNLHGGGHAGKF